jgi:HlyD family secretion protein
MKKKRLLILIFVVILVGLLAVHSIRARNRAVPGAIRLSGNFEITTAQVSFKIPGRVVQRLVSEGQTVVQGQIVALLDKTELEQEVAMLRASAEVTHGALAELEAGTRPEEVDQAVAGLEIAKAEAVRLQNEFVRQQELFKQKVISPREFEAAEAASRMSSAKVQESEARLALLKKGPREETIGAARARLEQARQAVALAETRLRDATLTSPLTGIVMANTIENGEYVVPGTPVVTVGDWVNIWLRAYVDETDLGRIKIGQKVKITTDTYPGKAYEGRVSFIASQAEFTPKNVQTAKERVKLVYRIKVNVTNPGQELKPGMPADAEIWPNGG